MSNYINPDRPQRTILLITTQEGRPRCWEDVNYIIIRDTLRQLKFHCFLDPKPQVSVPNYDKVQVFVLAWASFHLQPTFGIFRKSFQNFLLPDVFQHKFHN